MIGISVIGAGVIGKVHAENIARSPDCQLIHVADLDLAKASALASRLGAVDGGASVQAVLRDDRVQAVVIASSTSAREQHVLQATQAGQAIPLEKPISDSLKGARTCLDAVTDAGVVASMGFNRRFDRNHRGLFQAVGEGKIGHLETLHLTSRSQAAPDPRQTPLSGGMLREKGAHFNDLACWIARSEPVSVFAAGACLFEPAFREYGDVDTAVVTLRLKSGAIASFDFSRRNGYGYDERIEVHGSLGMLESRRPRRGDLSLYRSDTITEDGLHQGWFERFEETYRQELAAFVGAVRGERAPHATLADGFRAQAIAEAADRPASENRPIDVTAVGAS